MGLECTRVLRTFVTELCCASAVRMMDSVLDSVDMTDQKRLFFASNGFPSSVGHSDVTQNFV